MPTRRKPSVHRKTEGEGVSGLGTSVDDAMFGGILSGDQGKIYAGCLMCSEPEDVSLYSLEIPDAWLIENISSISRLEQKPYRARPNALSDARD